MKKVNSSTSQMWRYQGKWIAIDYKQDKIVAVGNTLEEIAPFVSGKKGEEHKVKASAFKVPRKDEGPYVLAF